MAKQKILFLCTGNSCRSQMAEGWARHLHGETMEVCSAGIEIHGLNPLAVRAMALAGVDISSHYSKLVDDLQDVQFDLVITVCDRASESCPMFPKQTKVIHVGYEDPDGKSYKVFEKTLKLIHMELIPIARRELGL